MQRRLPRPSHPPRCQLLCTRTQRSQRLWQVRPARLCMPACTDDRSSAAVAPEPSAGDGLPLQACEAGWLARKGAARRCTAEGPVWTLDVTGPVHLHAGCRAVGADHSDACPLHTRLEAASQTCLSCTAGWVRALQMPHEAAGVPVYKTSSRLSPAAAALSSARTCRC